ncbi:hypothetical protein HY086_03895 [Candidatus Gottesmanbacteria bacterium]|nr:hypothetical protein [Candidatus Gottesmanbacteria bacterium]
MWNILLGFFILVLFGVLIHGQKPLGNSFSHYATEIFTRCANRQFTPACYDEEIPKLMDRPTNLTMEETFEVTRLIQKKDSKYLYCHVLAHSLSYKETGKDLTKWKDVVARCPTTMCNNGCQHGALMRRFNSETLTDAEITKVTPDLANVCEPRGKWHPVEVERSMCYHALGHLNMFVTGADVKKSVGLCQNVGTKPDGRNYIQTCTEGTLMTIYQPLEAEDRALVKGIVPTKESMASFCKQFMGEAYHACHRESWPLFVDQVHRPDGLVAFCSYTDDMSEQRKCYATALNIITVYLVIGNENKTDKISDFCRALPGDFGNLCFASAARRMVQIDPKLITGALAICVKAAHYQLGDQCFNELIRFSSLTYHKGSEDIGRYCGTFPGAWREKCLQNNQ